MADEKTIAKVRKFVETYSRKGAYGLYPDAAVVDNVVLGLADNLEQHGKMYCPCAPVEESKQKGREMVCPCTPHHADIARQGYCDCALFASHQFVEKELVEKELVKKQNVEKENIARELVAEERLLAKKR